MRRVVTFISIVLIVIAFGLVSSAAQHTDLNAIEKRFRELHTAGNFPGALVEARKLEAGVKAQFGTNHPNYAVALNNLGIVYEMQDNFREAEAYYKRALAINEAKLGQDHPNVANTLTNLAVVYKNQGKYAEAEAHQKRALEIWESKFGKDHLNVADALNNLANVYERLGKYAEAEAHLQRALAIKKAKLGQDHPSVAGLLENLGSIYRRQSKYAEAEGIFKHVLAIKEEKLGKDHPTVADTLNNLGIVYEVMGKYQEAEAYYQRALAIRETKLGRGHTTVAQNFNNLANVYERLGKYAEAEAYYQRALAILEVKLGKDHSDVAATINNLASLYQEQGRFVEAEAYLQRALAIKETNFGKDHPTVADTLNNLAVAYERQGKYVEAEAYYQRALAIYEGKLGKDHPDLTLTLNNLAIVYEKQRKYTQAAAYNLRALAIKEAKLGKHHPDVADTLNNLAVAYERQGKYVEAEAQYQRVLNIREAKFDKTHPKVAKSLDNLSGVYRAQNKYVAALASSRKASAAVIAHAQMEGEGAQQTGGARGLVEQRADFFRRHVSVLSAAAKQNVEPDSALGREGFEIAQWAARSSAAAALAQMSARQAKGEGALARVVRERQDLEPRWQATDRRLNEAVAKGDVAGASELRRELSLLKSKFAEIDARLVREFPDYAVLSQPKPLSIADTQTLLSPDEALFLTVDAFDGTFAWLVTKTDARWAKLALNPSDIADKVQALRCGLDYSGEWGAQDEMRKLRCMRLLSLKAPPAPQNLPFSLQVAHELYQALFEPFKNLIKDKNLLIVPSGALASLPFQVLNTDKPDTAYPTGGDYRGVAWLGQRHALSVLPSVTSLKALREDARRRGTASKSYLGFGNPLLTGPSGSDQSALRKQTCTAGDPVFVNNFATRSALGGDIGKLFRGGLGNITLLKQQEPLPETADELCAIGRTFAAAPDDILLGAKATERMVKSLNVSGALANYRVLHFATHGLLPRETASIAAGLAEASLLLTPPDQASEEDDGLLTASEVTQLKLNAEWVILSACNSGGGDISGEALSGLARAFFYAGARSLLVSHWYVDSQSAVALTTKAINEMQRDPKLGRAEALRRSMRALMDSEIQSAHPANWAPFVVVGEGAAR